VVAVLLRLPAYLASAHLSFDDGVYGASAVAMRNGGRPFAEVFASQGPLWLPLVWLGDLAGFRTASSPRVIAVVAGVVLTLTTYAVGRRISDRGGALLAAGIVTTGVGVLSTTGPVAADGTALAAATVAVALAIVWRESPSAGRAIAMGVAVGVALSIKSLVVPAVIPVAMVLLSWRQVRLVLLSGGTAIVVNVLATVPWGWHDVWEQSYEYHLEASTQRTPGANLAKTVSTLVDRELPLVVASVLALVVTVAAGRWAWGRRLARSERPPRFARGLANPDLLLAAWLLGVLVVLAVEYPMWRPHVAHLVPAGALLAARYRPRWQVLAIAAVPVVPYHVDHAWWLLSPAPYEGFDAEAVDAVQDLPPGAQAISDEPGLIWRAGRDMPPDMVDTSMLRIEVGQHDGPRIAEVAGEPEVCAVVVTSASRWGSFDDLPDLLAELGYEPTVTGSGPEVVYVRDPCDPPG
jgi:hypothetical protein